MIGGFSLHFSAFQNIALAQILAHDNVDGNTFIPSIERSADVAEW
jgi:hypothetical protein